MLLSICNVPIDSSTAYFTDIDIHLIKLLLYNRSTYQKNIFLIYIEFIQNIFFYLKTNVYLCNMLNEINRLKEELSKYKK